MSADRRVAIVTGAGSGIGRAVSLALLADGFDVALAGRRREKLEETAAKSQATASVGQISGQTLVVSADVRDPASVDALFRETVRAFGRVDVLFNNAGIIAPGVPLEDLTFADWQAVVDTNLTGMFLCAQAAFRQMKAQSPRGGRIVNNGSISAHSPRPDSAPYTATKHAVAGLTKSIALDGRKYDIACGQIDVGNAATDMIDRTFAAGALASSEPKMDVRHVAQTVLHMVRLPLDANVLFLTITATKMPFVGRG